MQSYRAGPQRAIPDIIQLLAAAEREKLAPVIQEQNEVKTTTAVATGVATAVAERLVAAAELSAGVKRERPAKLSKAQRDAATAAAAAVAGTAVTVTPGAPGTRAAKRATRTAEHKAKVIAEAQAAAAAPHVTAATLAAAAATGAPPPAAPAPPAPGATPEFPPITRFTATKGSTDVGAVEAFDQACRAAGLTATPPCAFHNLKKTGCQGAPACKRCVAQLLLPARTEAPAGLVDRIKRACNASTLTLMV